MLRDTWQWIKVQWLERFHNHETLKALLFYVAAAWLFFAPDQFMTLVILWLIWEATRKLTVNRVKQSIEKECLVKERKKREGMD